jgi:membrane-associated phospholipid phosphatase
LVQGSGSLLVLALYVALYLLAMQPRRLFKPAIVIADWLPLLALPLLYLAIPATIVYRDGRVFDPIVQGWDRLLFGTDPSRTMAGALPFNALSELLHLAYLAYYLLIYGPPLLMYLRGDLAAFRRTVLAFTIGATGCFVLFCVFPVEGPRYAWPAPVGIPDGPLRSLALTLLEAGSSRGTAFPSSHLAIALAISLSSMDWNRRVGGLTMTVTGLLGVGAVYGGFHYGVDMLAGAAVGLGGWVVSRHYRGGNAALG